MRKFTHPLRTLRSCAQLRTLAHFLRMRTSAYCVLGTHQYAVKHIIFDACRVYCDLNKYSICIIF